MHAILLVGGKGSRLSPYTNQRPKALMRLGQFSILEIILTQLRARGFHRVTLCVSHLGDMIRQEFGDGERLRLAIDYSVDDRPLGTAAPLRLVPDWTSPALVMNGDVLTSIDFADLHLAHTRGRGVLTAAFQRRQLRTGVGLLRLHGDRVAAVWEKPRFEWNLCSGIYVADPRVTRYLPADTPADMPQLMTTLIEHGEPVRGYRIAGAWHDIGTPERYERARTEFLADPGRFLDPVPRPAGGAIEPVEPEPVDIASEPRDGFGDDPDEGLDEGLDLSVLGPPIPESSAIETRT